MLLACGCYSSLSLDPRTSPECRARLQQSGWQPLVLSPNTTLRAARSESEHHVPGLSNMSLVNCLTGMADWTWETETKQSYAHIRLIPKVGSSEWRWAFRHGGLRRPSAATRKPGARSFVIVRDPLSRLLSAYFTIAGRFWTNEVKHHSLRVHPSFTFMQQESDILRFEGMVETLAQLNGALPAYATCEDTRELLHAAPQMWFLGAVPTSFEFVGHLEQLGPDLQDISDRINLGSLPVKLIVDKQCSPVTRQCPNASYASNNAEGQCQAGARTKTIGRCSNATATTLREELMSSTRLLHKVWQYLHADYTCLGYIFGGSADQDPRFTMTGQTNPRTVPSPRK